jgi:hypothetical protein
LPIPFFKKAILKPLSLGIEIRVAEKLLLTFFRSELLQITGVTVGIHISGTLSNLFSERHELTEKTI